VIPLQQWLRSQRINELQAGSRTERHPDGHRPIQLHHRGRCDLHERIVECHYACPVCLRRGPGTRVTGGDRGLERVRAKRAAELLGAFERGETAVDEELIPATAVLIEEQNGLPRRADSCPQTRRLDLHQRNEAPDLRLLREEPGQDTPETERLFAELRACPRVTAGRCIAFVEDEIDDLKHRREADGELGFNEGYAATGGD